MALINELKTRRDNLLGYLGALDKVIQFEEDINALRVDVPDPAQSLAVASAATSSEPKPRAKRSNLKPIVQRGGDKSPRALIVNAISNLPEPFTMGHVRDWVTKHDPASAGRIGRSTWGTTIYGLRELGWITELGEKVDNRTAYKRGRGWPAGGALKSAKEQAYQDFRATVHVPASVEA